MKDYPCENYDCDFCKNVTCGNEHCDAEDYCTGYYSEKEE
jgi:hypothetical protein